MEDANNQEAKKGYKKSKKPSFANKLNSTTEQSKYPDQIQAEDEYSSDVPSDIRM